MADARLIFARYAGPCWRAVPVGSKAQVLDGTVRAGRYNRSGDRALYMSGSPAGVQAAMTRYGPAERTIVRLSVTADRLVDLRDREACAAIGIDPLRAAEDWLATLQQRLEPGSWSIADAVRARGSNGLIESSRHMPGEWHLVLFEWNVPGAALVSINPDRAS